MGGTPQSARSQHPQGVSTGTPSSNPPSIRPQRKLRLKEMRSAAQAAQIRSPQSPRPAPPASATPVSSLSDPLLYQLKILQPERPRLSQCIGAGGGIKTRCDDRHWHHTPQSAERNPSQPGLGSPLAVGPTDLQCRCEHTDLENSYTALRTQLTGAHLPKSLPANPSRVRPSSRPSLGHPGLQYLPGRPLPLTSEALASRGPPTVSETQTRRASPVRS